MQTKPVTQGSIIKDQSFDNCRIVETRHSPNVSYDFHSHKEGTITFLIYGSFKEEFCGKEFECGQFDILHKPAGTEHRNVYHKEGAHSLLIEFFNDNNDLNEYSENGKYIPACNTEFAQNLAIKLCSLFYKGSQLVSLAAEELELEISQSNYLLKKEAKIPPWLKKSKEYLDANIFENVTLSCLSEIADVHPVYFARCFRKFYNYPVSQYLHKKRLSNAIKKISSAQHKISEIAYEHGYSDQSHFTHFFKRETGFTPKAFRKRFQSYNLI